MAACEGGGPPIRAAVTIQAPHWTLIPASRESETVSQSCDRRGSLHGEGCGSHRQAAPSSRALEISMK